MEKFLFKYGYTDTDGGDDDDDIPPLPLPIVKDDLTLGNPSGTPTNGKSKYSFETLKNFPSTNPFKTPTNPSSTNPFETATDPPTTNPFHNPFITTCTTNFHTPQQQTPPSLPPIPLMPQLDLSFIKRGSKNLISQLIDEDEWARLNVSGTRGKDAINRDIITYVKACTFYMYPAEVGEDLNAAWRQCVRAIDAGARSIVRKRKI